MILLEPLGTVCICEVPDSSGSQPLTHVRSMVHEKEAAEVKHFINFGALFLTAITFQELPGRSLYLINAQVIDFVYSIGQSFWRSRPWEHGLHFFTYPLSPHSHWKQTLVDQYPKNPLT